MSSKPRVLVMGLGGIGGVVAAHLVEQGYDVTAVSTNAAIRDAVNGSGFWIGGDGDPRIIPGHAVAEPPIDGPGYDFILLATQPPQVEVAARTAAGALADDGVMVVFQNGLCEERVARIVGEARVVGAIIAWGASKLGAGRYQRTSAGGFTIGRMDGPPDAKCETLSLMLESIGPTELTHNLRGARWSKLALNCAISTLGTVGGDRLGPLLAHRFVRRLGLEVMTEVVAVARAEGVRLEKVAGTVDLTKVALTEADQKRAVSPGLLAKHTLLLAVGARYRRLRSSMLSAIERGRPPAVDYLNGEIVTRADRHGLAVPVNARLQSAVRRIAEGEARSGLELLRRIYDETRPTN